MKIAITQRVDFFKERNEHRDSLDHDLVELILSLGHKPLLISNLFFDEKNKSFFYDWLDEFRPEGIIFSGGNDFGDFKNRDKTEEALYFWTKNKIPILGICRGMQLIGKLNGSKLKKVKNHINKNHLVIKVSNKKEYLKNSFHAYSLLHCPKNFKITYLSKDGEIEGIAHDYENIIGIMWHPEREKTFSKNDINLLKKIFK